MNKKAQGTPVIITIIAIIVAVVVLVFLIFWFTGGGGQLGDWVGNIFGKPNVGTLTQSCQVACTTESNYDYCERVRDIRWEDSEGKLQKEKATCKQIKAGKTADGKILPAATIDCDLVCGSEKTCENLGGSWDSVEKNVGCPETHNDETGKVTDVEDKKMASVVFPNKDFENRCCVPKPETS